MASRKLFLKLWFWVKPCADWENLTRPEEFKIFPLIKHICFSYLPPFTPVTTNFDVGLNQWMQESSDLQILTNLMEAMVQLDIPIQTHSQYEKERNKNECFCFVLRWKQRECREEDCWAGLGQTLFCTVKYLSWIFYKIFLSTKKAFSSQKRDFGKISPSPSLSDRKVGSFCIFYQVVTYSIILA